jgi:hypothetical protein
MNIEIPDDTPIKTIIEMAAAHGFQVRWRGKHSVKMEQAGGNADARNRSAGKIWNQSRRLRNE